MLDISAIITIFEKHRGVRISSFAEKFPIDTGVLMEILDGVAEGDEYDCTAVNYNCGSVSEGFLDPFDDTQTFDQVLFLHHAENLFLFEPLIGVGMAFICEKSRSDLLGYRPKDCDFVFSNLRFSLGEDMPKDALRYVDGWRRFFEARMPENG